MRNADNICVECGDQIPPGAPVAIVHGWDRTPIEGWSPRTHRQHSPWTSKRTDRWVCLDCVRSKYEIENRYADTGRCENCDREIRHWDFSHPMPSACCAECKRLASNKRSRERRRVKHEPTKCVVCGEMFEPRRADAKTCSKAHRQKLYRDISKWPAVENKPKRRVLARAAMARMREAEND